MRKQVLFSLFSLVLLLVLASSCYEDKGNYKYTQMNDIEVITPAVSISTISIGESFSAVSGIVDLTDTTLLNSEELAKRNYKYEWVLVGGGDVNLKVIAETETPVLDDYNPTASAGSYLYFLRVTDNETGIQYVSENFRITIINDIATGPIFLANNGTYNQLYFINIANSKFDLRIVNPENMFSLDDAISITCSNDYNAPMLAADGYSIAIATKQTVQRLKHEDLSYQPEYDMARLFLGNVSSMPEGWYLKDYIVPFAYATTGFGFIQTNEDNLMRYFFSPNNVCLPSWGTYINRFEGKLFKPSSHMALFGDMIYRNILFNEDTKSFMAFTSQNSNCGSIADPANALFSFSNTGWDLLALDRFTKIGEVQAYVRAVVKDPTTNIYYLISFDVDGNQYSMQDVTHLPEIANATEFFPLVHVNNSSTNSYMFYRTETTVYSFHMSTGKHTVAYTAPTGQTISMMKEIPFGTISANEWEGEYIATSSQLNNYYMIFTHDPAAPEESCGSLEFKRINTSAGELVPAYLITYTDEFRDERKDESEYIMLPKFDHAFGKVYSVDWKRR